MGGSPSSDDGIHGTYHRARRWRNPALALAAIAGGTIAWYRWRPFRVEVAGRSMAPTLEPGDWALAVRGRTVRPGDVVVVEHPSRPGLELVKRVVAGPGGRGPDARELAPGEIWVQGDAPAGSTDSRAFGPVDSSAVRGRVVLVWWPVRDLRPIRRIRS